MPSRQVAMVVLAMAAAAVRASTDSDDVPASRPVGPNEVFIPYKNLRETLERHGRGVFLPYDEFQRLWDAAHRLAPAGGGPAGAAPVATTIGRVSYSGSVTDETASLKARIEFDVLTDDWATLDLRLRDVAVRSARFIVAAGRRDQLPEPLLHLTPTGQQLITRGRGVYALELELLKKLELQPGRTRLSFEPVPASIAMLDLTVPVDGAEIAIEPLLAASTQPVATQPAATASGRTRIQAFIAPVERLTLTWAARTELASGLSSVLEVEQRHAVSLTTSGAIDRVDLIHTIRHAPRDRFEIELPAGWRVLGLDAAGMQSWSVKDGDAGGLLSVKLYEAAKDRATMRVELERVVTGDAWTLDAPILRTRGAVREGGFIAIRQPDGLQVQIATRDGMIQIDPAELPEELRKAAMICMRFLSTQARLAADVSRVRPRLGLHTRQTVRLDDEFVHLAAELDYVIEAAGVFGVRVKLPQSWDVLDLGPADLVEDRQFEGPGDARVMTIALRRKVLGPLKLTLSARRPRGADSAAESIALLDAADPIAATYSGAVIIMCKDHIELKLTDSSGLRPAPLNEIAGKHPMDTAAAAGYEARLGFEFVDRKRADLTPATQPAATQPAAAPLAIRLGLERRKTRITATVSTLLDLSDAQTRIDAVLKYDVQYSDVEELRFKIPAMLRDDQLNITGDNIREKRVVPNDADREWRHWRITLARPARGAIPISVRWDVPRTTTQPNELSLPVPEIVTEGPLEHADGQVIVRTSENFQTDVAHSDGLRPIDVSEIKCAAHRDKASLAFAYDRPGFSLMVAATRQEFQEVAQLVVDRILFEGAVSRSGDVTTRAVFVIQANALPNLKITLPAGAKLLSHAWVDGRPVVPQRPAGNTQVVLVPLSGGSDRMRRAIVEIMYATTGTLGTFEGAALESGTPVQETRWLLWIPSDLEPIWHDTAFIPIGMDWISALASSRDDALQQARWATGGGGLNGSLATEGKPMLFRKLGEGRRMSATIVGRTTWRVIVNALWMLVGLAGLRWSWRRRSTVALAIVVLGSLIAAMQPLFVSQALAYGWWGLVVAAAIWLGNAVFFAIPRWWAARREAWIAVPAAPATSPPIPGTAPISEGTDHV